MKLLQILTLPCLLSLPLSSFSEEPTSAEVEWVSLFDGTDLSHWGTKDGGEPGEGWVIEDGTLFRKEKGGDLYTKAEFGDFELELEWKISEAGNSGIKYRVTESETGKMLGPEFQVLDDEKHPDSKKGRPGTRQAGSFYDVIAADPEQKELNAVGEWNKVRIVAKGTVCQHWLNGKLVVEFDTTSPEFADAVTNSKFKEVERFAKNSAGFIYLQDHSDPVWYRNIRIRELD